MFLCWVRRSAQVPQLKTHQQREREQQTNLVASVGTTTAGNADGGKAQSDWFALFIIQQFSYFNNFRQVYFLFKRFEMKFQEMSVSRNVPNDAELDHLLEHSLKTFINDGIRDRVEANASRNESSDKTVPPGF